MTILAFPRDGGGNLGLRLLTPAAPCSLLHARVNALPSLQDWIEGKASGDSLTFSDVRDVARAHVLARAVPCPTHPRTRPPTCYPPTPTPHGQGTSQAPRSKHSGSEPAGALLPGAASSRAFLLVPLSPSLPSALLNRPRSSLPPQAATSSRSGPPCPPDSSPRRCGRGSRRWSGRMGRRPRRRRASTAAGLRGAQHCPTPHDHAPARAALWRAAALWRGRPRRCG